MPSDTLIVLGNTLSFAGKSYHCAIGKNGFTTDKKEGDGCTPLGAFPLRECWYRADRMPAPITHLPLNIIKPEDGWCDDVKSADYNKHITVPSPLEGEGWVGGGATASSYGNAPNPNPPHQGGRGYENLYRPDGVYDLIIPLGYNDNPIIPGKGSAIFLHIATPDYSGTEGCIALSQQDLLEVLRDCSVATTLAIQEDIH